MTVVSGARRAIGALDATLRRSDERWRAVIRAVVILTVIGAAWTLGSSPSIRLVGLLFVMSAVFVLVRAPHIAVPALIVAIAILPYEVNRGGASINVAMLGVASLAGFWVIDMALNQRLSLRASESNRAWFALVGVAALSIVAGSAFWNPLVLVKSNFFLVQLAQLSVYVLAALAFWLGANFVRTRSELKWLTAIMITNGALVLITSNVGPLRFFRGRLLLDSVNATVWFVSLAMGLALFHDRIDKRLRTLLFALAVATVVIPLLRGGGWVSGWISPLVALSTLMFLRLGRRSFRLVIAVSPFVPLVVFALVRRLIVAESWSYDTRLIAWRGLFDLVSDRWVFGLGLASYGHYWRGVIGSFSYLDPLTGYIHSTLDPKVNMHNNYLDVYGQMGVIGVLAFIWLFFALIKQTWRVFMAEPSGFGRAYAAAAVSAIVALSVASMLGDYVFPFVYNIGLRGFRDAGVGWVLLGGAVALGATRQQPVGPHEVEPKPLQNEESEHPVVAPNERLSESRHIELKRERPLR